MALNMMVLVLTFVQGLDLSHQAANESPTQKIQNDTSISGDQSTGDTLSPEVRQFSQITAKYLFPIIIVIGSVGNGLSFAVLLRKKLRSNSLYFYFRVLTCADTLVLYISCFKTWLRVITSFELLHVSDVACKLIMFMLLVGMHLAAWIIVLVTFDRCISVWLPFRAASICTPRRACVITSIVTAVIILYNIHVFWTIGLHVDEYSGYVRCIASPDIPFMQEPFEYLKLATYSFIPFSVVFALNLGIIYKISQKPTLLKEENSAARSHREKRPLTGGSPMTNRGVSGGRQQRVIYMLLTLSFSWLILTAPYAVITVLMTAYPHLMGRNMTTILKTISFIFLYLNHSINFYLYCITGQKFRQEFKELICRGGEEDVINTDRSKSFRTMQTPVGSNSKEQRRRQSNGHYTATFV